MGATGAMGAMGAMSLDAKASDRESLRVDGYALGSIKHLSKAKRSKAKQSEAKRNLQRTSSTGSRHFKTPKRERLTLKDIQGFRRNRSTLQSHGQENLPWLHVMAARIL